MIGKRKEGRCMGKGVVVIDDDDDDDDDDELQNLSFSYIHEKYHVYTIKPEKYNKVKMKYTM